MALMIAALAVEDATLKSFLTAVGVWPVFALVTLYFLFPVAWTRVKDL